MESLDFFWNAHFTRIHGSIATIFAQYSRPDNFRNWLASILDILSSPAVCGAWVLFPAPTIRGLILRCPTQWYRIHAHALSEHDDSARARQPDDDVGLSPMDNLGSVKTV